MFVRNGQVLGSVCVAELKASAETPEHDEPEQVETEDETEEATSDEVDEATPPKQYAAKAEWVKFAVAKGADEDEATDMSRADLIKRYGERA